MHEELDLLRSVGRLARELSAAFDVHLRGLNLTSARARILMYLLDLDKGASQAEVTGYLGVEQPTAVRILDGIEALGYVQRIASPQDRRVKIIVLTAKGRAVAQKVSRLVSALNDRLLEQIPASELNVVRGVLSELLTRAQTIRSSALIEEPAGAER
jgi:MarR family transcriptional regulator, transcriptional regulator for hemolysin